MSISSRITNMTTNISNAYDSLEKLGQTADNKNLENLSSLIDNIYDNAPKTEYQEGTSIDLGSTLKGKLDYDNGVVGIGQSSQDGTPTPDNEVPIQCVTGNQDVVVSSSNVLTNTTWTNGKYLNSNDEEVDNANWKYTDYINIGKDKWIYRPSAFANAPKSILYDVNKNKIAVLDISDTTYNLSNYNNAYYIRISAATNSNPELYITPTTHQLSLGDRKVFEGDYFWIDTSTGKKYHHHKFSDITFTGASSESWDRSNTNVSGEYRFTNSEISTLVQKPTDNNTPVSALCNRLIAQSSNYTFVQTQGFSVNSSGVLNLFITSLKTESVANFKTWLSSNNLYFVYQLATETDEEITGTLAEQLEAWYNAQSINGTTIITSNGDLPMILKVRALSK